MLDLAWASLITLVAILWIRLTGQVGVSKGQIRRNNSNCWTDSPPESTSSLRAQWVNPAGSSAAGWQLPMPCSWYRGGWSAWFRFHRWSPPVLPLGGGSTPNWCCRHYRAGRSYSQTCPASCSAMTVGGIWVRQGGKMFIISGVLFTWAENM